MVVVGSGDLTLGASTDLEGGTVEFFSWVDSPIPDPPQAEGAAYHGAEAVTNYNFTNRKVGVELVVAVEGRRLEGGRSDG